MIKFSVTSIVDVLVDVRFGTISAHQGKSIASRSEKIYIRGNKNKLPIWRTLKVI